MPARDARRLEVYRRAVAKYSYPRIVQRISDAVKASRRPLKQILEGVDIKKDQWSRKMKPTSDEGGTKTSFNYSEITRIAEYFGYSDGWPFIDLEIADANRRALEALSRSGLKQREPPTPKKASESPARPRGRKPGGGKILP